MPSIWFFLSIFVVISRLVLLRTRNVTTKVVEKITTHILNSITFSRKPCSIWNHAETYRRTGQATNDNIIRRVYLTWCVTKATNTNSEYAVLIAFPRLKRFRQRFSELRLYVYCLSFWNYNYQGFFVCSN